VAAAAAAAARAAGSADSACSADASERRLIMAARPSETMTTTAATLAAQIVDKFWPQRGGSSGNNLIQRAAKLSGRHAGRIPMNWPQWGPSARDLQRRRPTAKVRAFKWSVQIPLSAACALTGWLAGRPAGSPARSLVIFICI